MDGWAVSGMIAEISFNFVVYIPKLARRKNSLHEDMKDTDLVREREYERERERIV